MVGFDKKNDLLKRKPKLGPGRRFNLQDNNYIIIIIHVISRCVLGI